MASSDPEDLLPDYWQNPEGLELKLVVDRTELQVGQLLTIRDVSGGSGGNSVGGCTGGRS